jgi:hypothetical protein
LSGRAQSYLIPSVNPLGRQYQRFLNRGNGAMGRLSVWINSAALLAVGAMSFGAVLWSEDIPWAKKPGDLDAAAVAADLAMPLAANSPARPSMSPQQAGYLVRSTVKTLSDANRTGNYTVLRDLAAAKFQERHSTAQLSAIFGPLRSLPLDLAQAALMDPVLSVEPVLGARGDLRMTGYFATSPVRIAFTMEFASNSGHWQLTNIDVSTHALQASL